MKRTSSNRQSSTQKFRYSRIQGRLRPKQRKQGKHEDKQLRDLISAPNIKAAEIIIDEINSTHRQDPPSRRAATCPRPRSSSSTCRCPSPRSRRRRPRPQISRPRSTSPRPRRSVRGGTPRSSTEPQTRTIRGAERRSRHVSQVQRRGVRKTYPDGRCRLEC